VDAVDRKILAELQRDGRLTITELADRVRLSVSPCHRRLRALENSGAISGYRAQLDAQALGLTFEKFEQSVTEIPNVLQAQRLFGDPDYLLRVVTRDLAAFQRLYDEQLTALPGVQRLTSTLVMKSVAEGRPLPL
jgi:DNA-binding Lrp family transcriptional regulator